jgi:hypothetical protein
MTNIRPCQSVKAPTAAWLLRCHAHRCDPAAIVAALGLELKDIAGGNGHRTTQHKPRRKIVTTYDYEDEGDSLLYQVVRREPKDFRQRQPDGKGGWIWNMEGVRKVLYGLSELRRRITNPEYRRQHGLPDDVFVVEGEKDADRLHARGLTATTNVGGAGKWRDEYARQLVEAGAKSVIVIPDDDKPGRQHATEVAKSCHAAGLAVKVLGLPGLPEKGDVSDFLNGEGDRLRMLVELAATAPAYAQAVLVPEDQGARSAAGRTAPNASPSVATAQWPQPLRPTAYSGVLSDLVRLIEPHTEADSAALLLQGAVMLGNCVGRSVHVRVEGDAHYLNLDVTLVGDSAKGRKGTSEARSRAPFRMVDETWASGRIVEGLSSGEGLIYQVRDPIEKLQPVKEGGRVIDYQTVIEDPGIDDKRLLVVESELASTLRVMMREGNTLSPVIRRAWDGHDLQVLTKHSPARATAPHISIIGHITADELRRYLDRTESGNGFANRFLFVCVRRSKLLPKGGGTIDLTEIATRLRAVVTHAGQLGELHFDGAADALWCDQYEQLSAGRPGLLGAVTARAEAQVLRLSCLFAVADGASAIGVAHLHAALEVWRYCFDSARYVFGVALGDPVADSILTALRLAGDTGVTRTDLSVQVFGRHRSSAELGRALDMLGRAGLARLKMDQDTGGRPAERWYYSERELSEESELTSSPRDLSSHSSLYSPSRETETAGFDDADGRI